MVNEKPWVAVACLCERVLKEADGVSSLIRVVDTYYLDVPDDLPEGVAAGLNVTLFLSLKSGPVVGRHEIGMVLHYPNGKTEPEKKWPVVFEGGVQGVNVVMNVRLEGSLEYGVYWFDVMWGQDVLTRVPLRIRPEHEQPKGKEPTADQ